MTKSGTNNFMDSVYGRTVPGLEKQTIGLINIIKLNSGEPNKPGELVRNVYGAALVDRSRKTALLFWNV